MPEDENPELRRLLAAWIGRRRVKISKTSLGVAILTLAAGLIIRPYLEGFMSHLGDKTADAIVPERRETRPTNLEPSRVSKVTYRVALVNGTTAVSDARIQEVVHALQRQVHEDLAPVWGVDAELSAFKRGEAPGPGFWRIDFVDHSDEPAALGYHFVTPDGLPEAKVSTATDKDYPDWTIVASHELLDMLVDPRTNLVVPVERNNVSRVYALEIATPTQEDTYQIDGVKVSDFVYPPWFEAERPTDSAQFDHLRLVHAPLTLRRGGYTAVRGLDKGEWKFFFATDGEKATLAERSP